MARQPRIDEIHKIFKKLTKINFQIPESLKGRMSREFSFELDFQEIQKKIVFKFEEILSFQKPRGAATN